ncbi:hypothetical protein FRC04_009455 [Tulasnella sp. 424]|nr:hypothetical protein FRC04_009455 [Tulasnella sp. 424]KAG8971908.1 hypothetical protein FRC05_010577 [Tulasnella sp. 425]
MATTSKLVVNAITRAMGRVAPLHLAEPWDNVGLLLEAPFTKPNARRVLLTIDLTDSVVQEALKPSTNELTTAAIVCYHPPLFRALKSLTLSTPLQNSMLTCIANGISIYSPHTALDSVKGGVNDWLASLLSEDRQGKGIRDIEILGEEKDGGAGIGRKVVFSDAVTLDEVVRRVKTGLGLKHVQLARGSGTASPVVKSVAICAGSGGSVIGDSDADLYFTGEMSHHEVLAAVARGTHVLLCGHSNTERGYLPTLRTKLLEELKTDSDLADAASLEVEVSQTDADPLEIV